MEKNDGWTDKRTYGQTDGRTNGRNKNITLINNKHKLHKELFTHC